MRGNDASNETPVLRAVLGVLAKVLPAGWSIDLEVPVLGKRPDLRITSSSGDSANFDVVTGRAGAISADALATNVSPNTVGLLYASDYISAPMRTKLAAAGISYVDGTGWVRLVADKPMLAVTSQGAARAPRDLTPKAAARLNGRSAGRIVRALADASPPIGVRDLAARAHVSPGTVSKVLPVLEADTAVQRDDAGRVSAVDRRQLIKRWATDYDVLKSNGRPSYSLAPRGLDQALVSLKQRRDVAFTGTTGALGWLPIGTEATLPTTQLVVYTAEPASLSAELGFVSVDAPTANVILLAPQDLGILDGVPLSGGIPLAPLAVVLADLMTLPGRYPQQAEALMDALAKTDPAWRP